MSNRIVGTRPPYPDYASTPLFGGDLPTIDQGGPPDLRFSSMNPAYSVYAGTWGRQLAGLGQEQMNTQTSSADEGIADYPNELLMLAEADDISGNGVFDPHGSPGNLHPDEGIFADKASMPGYLMRERFYAPSEVIDATTGEQVMYVPGGAVPIDQSQVDTFRARQLMMELQPGISPETFGAPAGADTWIPQEDAWALGQYRMRAVGQDDEAARQQRGQMIGLVAGFAVVGAAIGMAVATQKMNRRRAR